MTCGICGEGEATVGIWLQGQSTVAHPECFEYQAEQHDQFPDLLAAASLRGDSRVCTECGDQIPLDEIAYTFEDSPTVLCELCDGERSMERSYRMMARH